MKTEYTISPSHAPGVRIFVPANAPAEVHEALRRACIWGGADKADQRGIGYEFMSLYAALCMIHQLESTNQLVGGSSGK